MKTEAARMTFAERLRFTINLIAHNPGFDGHDDLVEALVRWWGWYGASAHGVVLLIPDDYLQSSPAEQLGFIEMYV